MTDNTEALPPLPEPFMELYREWSPHVYKAWAARCLRYHLAQLQKDVPQTGKAPAPTTPL